MRFKEPVEGGMGSVGGEKRKESDFISCLKVFILGDDEGIVV